MALKLGATVITMTNSAADRGSSRRHDAVRVMSLIDLTDLNDARTPDALADLVDCALKSGVPAVCVWPEFVARVASLLDADADRGSCLIAAVVNFPAGGTDIEAVTVETSDALAAGADEIDLVLPYRAYSSGNVGVARSMVERIADVVHESVGRSGRPAELKVILETGELADDAAVRGAARLAVDAGADFIKTSTGKTSVSATLRAVRLMADVVAETDRNVGLKPSGGIRTVDDAMQYLDVVGDRLGSEWATPDTFRFGASSLLDDAVVVAAYG